MRRARGASPRRKVCDEAERGAAIADNRTVFATVGTTRFDGLVEALGTEVTHSRSTPVRVQPASPEH